MDWLSMPPLTALRAFSALAETGSASAAGAALNVSHAAISQQVKALEGHMGVALVDRSGRHLALTPAGRDLADALRAGFGAIARTVEALTGADADRPLQISTTPGFAAQWLMPRLLDFRNRHPDVDVMINPTPERVALEPGGIDIAIRHGMGHWPGVEAERLFSSPLVVVAAPSLVAGRSIRRPEDLIDLPWVQEYGTSESTDWLSRKGLASFRIGGMTQVPGNLLLEGVRQGQGVSLTVRQWVEDDVAAGRLKLLFEEPEDTAYYIVTRPGAPRSKAKAFIGWLRKQAAASAN
ncbi:LysR family transcriptional regulator, glycine cleavage system transcriptional activator [Roseovarius litoreus]|uniref:LysR family transcriptional regulator, glycine cleavage system transcriptional activator n=1 Tax=Roseovarius litoreus TaxID=1155722 RepID=A0A1M6ZUB1_9RHOB|nr:LysR family transcriptional regulator [Roseovarius litoreus]SHL34020.1 LysR family transcriptional regulator, glycine cleavage system transcriptional activator [Roseovarius litoreus]